MRILMLAPETPVPATSGVRLRMLHIARALAASADLEVAVLGDVPDHEEPFPILSTRSASPRLRALASVGKPYLAARHESRDLERIAARAAPDTVQAEFPYLVPAAAHARVPIVLDAHNVESDLAGSFAASDPRRLWRARWRWEAGKLARFERDAVRAATTVCATSDADAATFEAMGAVDVVVVPNGVDTGAIPFSPAPPGGLLVVYVANFGYLPNLGAARELVEEILPRLRATVPGSTLRLVGRDAPARRADPVAGVEVVGDVEDVVPHLHAARVTVIPLRAGSGTRLKALEAMAAGVPVVSTRLGVAGLEVRDGEHVLLAESSAELADAAAAVLRDDALARRLAEAGRALVESRYDWPIVTRPLLEVHERLAGRR